MRQQRKKSNRLVIFVPILFQFLLVGGFIAFIILSQETLKQKSSLNFNGYSNTELSPAGQKTFESLDKTYLIPIYQKAAEKYKIPWEYLAGINYVESTLWTNKSASNVGAIGPMQFMERTWVGWSEQFTVDYPNAKTQHWGRGDIHDTYLDVIKNPEVIKKYGGLGRDGDGDGIADPTNEVDAIFSAAHYLANNGMAEGNIDKAIFSYNHSMDYVNKVKQKANEFTQPVSGGDQQFFGDGSGDGWGWPLPETTGVRITNGYGAIEAIRNYVPHSGTDFAAPNIKGQPVVATQSGIVVTVGYLGACGNHVTIDHGNGIKTIYCHFNNDTPLVSSGQQVQKGQLIGYVGTTGRSTGPHLHYGVKVNGRTVNPLGYINMQGMK